jgi:hypothetical protein
LEAASNQPSQSPGWYQDKNAPPGQLRWWDGEKWTENVLDANQRPVQPVSPAATGQGVAKKPWHRRPWVIAVAVIFGLAILSSMLSSPEDKGNSGEGAASAGNASSGADLPASGSDAEAQADPEKPNEATDDNTPGVGPNGQVTVDGLVWSVASAKTASTLGDPAIGTDEAADGVFVIVTLNVHSTKGETVTLTDEVVKIEGGPEGATYSADTDGTTAALLSSSSADVEPFFLEDLQPDTTTTGTVVFDIPTDVLASGPNLRFGELGFGETHGYIQLPRL